MGLTLATFNVKDLLDGPPDHVPRAPLDAKLACLAGVLERADADVVALQEVGSLVLVRALASRVPRLGYAGLVMGTVDARGIGCAVLSRVPVLASKVHMAEALPFPVFVDGDPAPFGARIPLRRGVVQARVYADGVGSVDLFVAHFKSNRPLPRRDGKGNDVPPVTERDYAEGQLRSLVWRASEALFVRGLVDDVLRAAPSAHVAVAGDFNDQAGSHVVRIVSGGGDRALAASADMVPPEARFSILVRGRRLQIDHLFVTPELRARQTSARFLNEDLRDHGALPEGAQPADSDHAALVVSFA